MNRWIFLLAVFVIFLIRWVTIPSPLPEGWRPESKLRLSATITQEVEYADAQTIVRDGIWYIKIKGYHKIIPGSRVEFVGLVEPKMSMGKVVQIKMIDPQLDVIGRSSYVMVVLGNWRERWVTTLQKTLPEPMASLASGILLGVKSQMPQDFYQALVNTGTLHIVAASGYNVSIVATVLMKALTGVVSRGVGIGFGIVGIVIYVLISGGSASVVRAGIMGSLTLIAYYFGRPAEARRVLWVTGALMLLINPLMIVDIGFQLSFVATVGLLYLEPWIKNWGSTWIRPYEKVIGGYLADYLFPTLAATIATLPVILWHFGRLSWISPLVNILVLPVVPLIMLLSGLALIGGQIMALILYAPLAYMIWVIKLF